MKRQLQKEEERVLFIVEDFIHEGPLQCYLSEIHLVEPFQLLLKKIRELAKVRDSEKYDSLVAAILSILVVYEEDVEADEDEEVSYGLLSEVCKIDTKVNSIGELRAYDVADVWKLGRVQVQYIKQF